MSLDKHSRAVSLWHVTIYVKNCHTCKQCSKKRKNIVQGGCVESVRWMCGVCQVDVWSLSGGCVESVRWMCGVCQVDVWSLSGGCVESVRWMCGVCQVDVWSLSGGCVESVRWMCGICQVDVWSLSVPVCPGIPFWIFTSLLMNSEPFTLLFF